MPHEWALSIVVPIIKGMGDIWNCSCYVAVKLLENGMKVVERVFAHHHGLLAVIRFPLGCGESSHPHMLGILPNYKRWLSCY